MTISSFLFQFFLLYPLNHLEFIYGVSYNYVPPHDVLVNCPNITG